MRAGLKGGYCYDLGTDQEFDLQLHAARDILARIEHMVHHWDEFTADHLAYPQRKTHEYAAWVRLLAEWRAYAAMYEYSLEHIRSGRGEEALLPYVRHDPRTIWDLFWVFAWEGNAHAIDCLCAHIVPQLLPQQEPFCRRALQTVIDTPWRDTDAMAGEAVQTALLATHFRITGPAPD